MLYSLSIKNIALIDNASICLSDGFNVLTGETGAGKSILVDSLNLLLGDRTDRELVRTGTDMAEIEGVFYVSAILAPEVAAQLDVQPEDGMLVVRRCITADGRSSIKVNGRTVTLSALRKAMQLLVDIYGQHEHQTLLHRENHIRLLDNYAQDELAAQLAKCSQLYDTYVDIYNRLHSDWGSAAERERRMDILDFQIDEITSAALYNGEEEELLNEKKRLTNAEYIAKTLREAHETLGDEGGACEALSIAVKALENLCQTDEIYSVLCERLRSACYEAEDIYAELGGNLDQVDVSGEALERIEERLQLIRELRRKYGADISEILNFAAEAKSTLARLVNASETIEKLTEQCESAQSRLYEASVRLSEQRRKAAGNFTAALSEELTQLGMKSARFEVVFADLPLKEKAVYTGRGFDDVEFLFSANLGEPLKPLIKVISGGEMSRFMLAVKGIMANADNIETMVFDEIDTGISGKMAQVTAEKMAAIARRHQVLCVTHLPQIAAMATTHFFVEKRESGGVTKTSVVKLSRERRAYEIARLTGGEVTQIALAHANEMLQGADIFNDKA